MKCLAGLTTLLAGVCLATSIASADSLWVGNLERPNVLIRQVKDGKIFYEIAGRPATPIEIDKVSRLDIQDEPALTAAEKSFAAGKWNDAAEQYQKALQTSRRDWVKDYAIPRLLEASSKAGRFDTASTAYLQLVLRSPEIAPRYKPQVPAGDSGYLQEAARETRTALGDTNLTPAQRQQLLLFLLDIQRARGDNAAIEKVANELAGLAKTEPANDPAAAARLKLGLAHVALDEKNYQKAIDQVESARELFTGPEQMADALFVLAQAKYGLAHASADPTALKDAAIAYMRVVAHFKDHADWPQVGQSLYMTAVIMQELNDPAAARDLYEQVVQQYPNHPAAAQAREKLAQLKSAK